MSSKKNRKTVATKTVGERLRYLMEERGVIQVELARLLGMKQGHLSDWLRDRSKPSKLSAMLVAHALGVNREWLIEGTGVMREDIVREPPALYGFAVPSGIPEDIPVVGRGRGGRGEFNVDGYPVGQGYKRVRRPFDVDDPQAFGVEVSGESMAPRYEAGDVVICSPKKVWRSGDYCVVVKEDGEALVKKVKDQGESVILSSLAPGVDPIMLHKKEIRAIHKIVWKKER